MVMREADRTLIVNRVVDLPIPDLLQAFILDRKASGVSKATIKTYGVEFWRFLAFCESNFLLTLQMLTLFILRSYLVHLKSTGRNPGGVHIGYRTVKSLLLWYENEVEPDNWKNPIRKVKPPKLPLLPIEPMALETVEKLFSVCDGGGLNAIRDRAMLLFLLDTGLRAFVACGADLGDLDLLSGPVLPLFHEGAGYLKIDYGWSQ